MARKAFIIGAGQVGHAVAKHLLADGWSVILASRSARAQPDLPGATTAALDREDSGALAKALAGGADAVIDTVAYTQAHADQLLSVQNDAGAFAVISSAGVYRDDAGRSLGAAGDAGFPIFPNPISETQSTVDAGSQTYASRKVALERALLDHAKPPVAILRPCAIHSPLSASPREWWFIKRMLDGRTVIPLAYRGESRFHTSAAANIAAATAAALEHGLNCVLNTADPQALSVAEIGAAIGHHLSYQGTILPLDVGDAQGHCPIGDTPWSTPGPFILDMSAALALGYRPITTYEAAVGAVCRELRPMHGQDWKAKFPQLAANPSYAFDYAAEDRALAAPASPLHG